MSAWPRLPLRPDDGADGRWPTHARTLEERTLELRGEELRAEISRRHRAEVQLLRLKQGIFDEARVSLIGPGTMLKIEREAGRQLDVRRFRPNIVIETRQHEAFEEDNWMGKTAVFGEGAAQPAVSVTLRGVRGVMINLDPETAATDPAAMKSVVRLNQNYARVCGTVIRTGILSLGQKVFWDNE